MQNNHPTHDVIIVGGGPAGLSCGLAAMKANLNYLILEKGCITDSIYRFPISMVFFTTRELIEIGNYPLNIVNIKPTREEALRYYAKFVIDNKININTYEPVTHIQKMNDIFQIQTKNPMGENQYYQSKKIIIATGVFDNPRMLDILGEDLAKVSHYFVENHPYVRKNVLIIGGRNSAAEAALELYRAGSHITIVHRGEKFSHLKYWVEPDLLNRISEGSIKAFMNAQVKEIRNHEVIIETSDGTSHTVTNDFVLALTGYQPNSSLLRSLGVQIDRDTQKPQHNPDSFETNIEGVFIAGVITAGNDSSLVFIENGRFHGEKIIPHIKNQLK